MPRQISSIALIAFFLIGASTFTAARSEAANVITPRAWVLINLCGANLVDVRGDHGYAISQIDNNGHGKLVSLAGKTESKRSIIDLLNSDQFLYTPSNHPPANLNNSFTTFYDGAYCPNTQFRAVTTVRWFITPTTPPITVTSPWRSRNCELDWGPPR